MKNLLPLSIVLSLATLASKAQILGGGTNFATATTFNNTWLTNCPSSAQTLSNVVTFEPTVPIDACAPAPSTACVPAGSTSGSDVWFKFFATSTSAQIVVAPTSAFNIVLQAFSGTACPGLTDIGCANALGNNGTETLNLTGLVVNQTYFFRIFGIGNNAGSRTGPYTFCGTTNVGSALVPLKFTDFTVVQNDNKALLHWKTESEINNNHFEIEKSENGTSFYNIGRVEKSIIAAPVLNYSFTDENIFNQILYYRIKQVDIDGHFSYSDIVKIKTTLRDNAVMTISPNPIQQSVNIKLHSTVNAISHLKIINEFGQVVYAQNIKVVKGKNEIIIPKPTNIVKGMYSAQVILGNEKFVSKFVCL